MLSPLVRAVLDAYHDEIIVLDTDRRIIYLNARARAAHQGPSGAPPDGAALRATVLAQGAEAVSLTVGGLVAGEVLLAPRADTRSWTHREREAIRETLARNDGKLGETARQLGISRTTLWRRLKGRPPDGAA
jgi:DNA-binding NtrC family response regulator